MRGLRGALFKTWFRVSRPMTLGVRVIVQNEAGQVLLVRHTYVAGLYMPGGGVERGQVAEDAATREVAEEAGIVLMEPPVLLGIFSNHEAFRNDHVLLYRAGKWQQGETDNAGEISEIVWADPGDLPGDVTAGTRRRLEAVFNGGPDSLYW